MYAIKYDVCIYNVPSDNRVDVPVALSNATRSLFPLNRHVVRSNSSSRVRRDVHPSKMRGTKIWRDQLLCEGRSVLLLRVINSHKICIGKPRNALYRFYAQAANTIVLRRRLCALAPAQSKFVRLFHQFHHHPYPMSEIGKRQIYTY